MGWSFDTTSDKSRETQLTQRLLSYYWDREVNGTLTYWEWQLGEIGDELEETYNVLFSKVKWNLIDPEDGASSTTASSTSGKTSGTVQNSSSNESTSTNESSSTNKTASSNKTSSSTDSSSKNDSDSTTGSTSGEYPFSQADGATIDADGKINLSLDQTQTGSAGHTTGSASGKTSGENSSTGSNDSTATNSSTISGNSTVKGNSTSDGTNSTSGNQTVATRSKSRIENLAAQLKVLHGYEHDFITEFEPAFMSLL